MLIKNTRIKSLLLALISLNVGYTYATGVIDITSDATAEEIAEAKEILATTTSDESSSYQLVEVSDLSELGDLYITKYLLVEDSSDIIEVHFNIVLNDGLIDAENNESLSTSSDWVDGTSVDKNFVSVSSGRVSGGAIYNYSGTIGNISGNFISNEVTSSGGAIYNHGVIGNINGDFISNKATSSGGAIVNYGTIGVITGDFINNYAYNGGAIINYSSIGNIIGDFIGNWAVSGGAIRIEYSNSYIKSIAGDFINNYASYYGGAICIMRNSIGIGDIDGDFVSNVCGSLDYAKEDMGGGAIYNESDIGNITGNFINNISYGSGGAIFNSFNPTATIGDITGSFIGNSSLLYNGGAIYNEAGLIGDITGDFTSNTAFYLGGAIYNVYADIGNIVGDFMGNSTSAENGDSGGGAIYIYSGSIGDITGSFIGNFSSTETVSSSYIYWTAKGGAICCDNTYGGTSIGDIQGDFICNYVSSTYTAKGGAIYTYTAYGNESYIGNITGSFYENYAISTADSYSSYAYGGAIYNYQSYNSSTIIGDITGVFYNNYAIASTTSSSDSHDATAQGGGIYNEGEIGNISGGFASNYTKAISANADAESLGGAIYNCETIASVSGSFTSNFSYAYAMLEADALGGATYNSSGADISYLYGDFTTNNVVAYSEADTATAQGGAIWNAGTLGTLIGNFEGNDAVASSEIESYAAGGAIYNSYTYTSATITSIMGDFYNNNVVAGTSALGGAIYQNKGKISNITGDFVKNSAQAEDLACGGAIYSDSSSGTFESITGNFIANSASVSSDDGVAYGGAIYNYLGTFTSISGDFFCNYVSTNSDSAIAAGGAIYNDCGTMSFLAQDSDMQFTGNYVSINGVETSNAIYNVRYSSYYDAVINMDAYGDYSITVNDGISGGDYVADQIININQSEGATSEVCFNNNVSYQTINVYNGSLTLGEYEGGTFILSSAYTTMSVTVDASSAMLSNCVLNIESTATVNTKADYLGSTSTITNNGTLNISGGTLSTSIAGAGTMNILGDVTVSSGSMSVVADSTLNNYATLTANLTVADGASVNAIITTENLGETIFDGSISGITTMDVSFDLTLDFNDVVGTTTTIYANESDGITLTLVDSDHISGASVVGNTVIVEDKIEITTDDYTALVTKDGDSTNIDVTAGSFEIAEGETQTLSNITTGADATLVITGGTLVTDNDFTLANDEATSGVKAESGVIESTATVQLSEGTTSVASGESLEVKAAVNLADNTQATLGASDASLILQKDLTLGSNSVLTLDGTVSGSANIFGDGTATINYTGTFSPGNSPELVSYSDVTVNYTVGSILEMEIFGEAGAGVDGGHDKIVFYGCNVSFDGTIQLNIDDVAALLGDEQSTTIVFDLFDFEDGSTIVSYSGDFELIYDASGWLVTVDTENLLVTGEVSLSIVAIPEPSTATLSLLALAGMLARRRRKVA